MIHHNDPALPGAQPDTELEAAWQTLTDDLTAYLTAMTAGDDDVLILELQNNGGRSTQTLPYAQFAIGNHGWGIRAELSGNAHLEPPHRLDDHQAAAMRTAGWSGGDDEAANWYADRNVDDDLHPLAAMVTTALRDAFAIPHPQLLTCRAWGAAEGLVGILKLAATDDVREEPATEDPDEPEVEEVPDPHVVAKVGGILSTWFGAAVTADDDSGFDCSHAGLDVHVQVGADHLLIAAQVADDVRSDLTTATRLHELNATFEATKWLWWGRRVVQTVVIPAEPFVPQHLVSALSDFFDVAAETTDTFDDLRTDKDD